MRHKCTSPHTETGHTCLQPSPAHSHTASGIWYKSHACRETKENMTSRYRSSAQSTPSGSASMLSHQVHSSHVCRWHSICSRCFRSIHLCTARFVVRRSICRSVLQRCSRPFPKHCVSGTQAPSTSKRNNKSSKQIMNAADFIIVRGANPVDKIKIKI